MADDDTDTITRPPEPDPQTLQPPPAPAQAPSPAPLATSQAYIDTIGPPQSNEDLYRKWQEAETQRQQNEQQAAKRMEGRLGYADAMISSPVKPPAVPQLRDMPQRPQLQYRDAFQVFQSPAILLATLGSLMTRRPAVNALTAGAAALNGFMEGDEKRVALEEKNWKNAVEQTIQQNEKEIRQFQAAFQNTQLSVQDRNARLNAVFAANKDEIGLAALKSGSSERQQQILDARIKANEGLRNSLLRITEADERARANQAAATERAQITATSKENVAAIMAEAKKYNVDTNRSIAEVKADIEREKEKGRSARATESQEGQTKRTEMQVTGREKVAEILADAKKYGIDVNQDIQTVKAEIERMKEEGREERSLRSDETIRRGQDLKFEEAKIRAKAVEGRVASGGDPAKEAKDIVDGIEKGITPPTLVGLYRTRPHVEAEAARRGINLSDLQLQYKRAEKQISTLNGPQMTRFAGLTDSVIKTIDEVKELSEKMKLGGISPLNKAELDALIKLRGNTEAGQLATRYVTSVNTLKEEFANLAQGGYAPTESVWHLANRQLNENYGFKQMNASLDEIRRLMTYRLNAIPNFQTLGPKATNPYVTPPPSGGVIKYDSQGNRLQ